MAAWWFATPFLRRPQCQSATGRHTARSLDGFYRLKDRSVRFPKPACPFGLRSGRGHGTMTLQVTRRDINAYDRFTFSKRGHVLATYGESGQAGANIEDMVERRQIRVRRRERCLKRYRAGPGTQSQIGSVADRGYILGGEGNESGQGDPDDPARREASAGSWEAKVLYGPTFWMPLFWFFTIPHIVAGEA